MSTPDGGRYALVVATSTYGDPKLKQLRAPGADAERLAEVLSDPDKGAFEVDVLLDENQSTTTRRIAKFFKDRRPHDLLLLHFSCHGVKDERGELYLAASDTEVDLLSATGVSAEWLNEQITNSRSKRTVVLLDCCFSGSFPFGMRARGGGTVDAPEQLQGRGRVIITASSALEYAYEGDGLQGEGSPSIFTSAIVEGLSTGDADLDGDARVSVDELYDYVYDKVKDQTPNQTPNKKSDLEGPLYLARSTRTATGAGRAVKPANLDPAPVAPRPAPASAVPPAPSRPPISADNRKRLGIGAGALAVVALLVVLLIPHGKDTPSGGKGVTGASASTPSAPTASGSAAASTIPGDCKSFGRTQFASDISADEEFRCYPPPYVASDNVKDPSLTYMRYGDSATARDAIAGIQANNLSHGWQACSPADAKKLASHSAEASCTIDSSDGGIEFAWHPRGSTTLGSATFDRPTTVAHALRAWQRVACRCD